MVLGLLPVVPMTLDLGAADGRRVAADAGVAARPRDAGEILLRADDVMTRHAPIATPRRALTPLQWLICVIAAIGFAFDSYELLMLPLIVRPALVELLQRARRTARRSTSGSASLFYVPAVAGGIFGLLGGYLTDLFGRRRVLVWSILLYAFSAFAAGYSTSVELAALLALLHVRRRLRRVRRGGGLAGGALPEPEAARGGRRLHAGVRVDRRPDGDRRLLPASSPTATACPRSRGGHEAWRYTLMSGVIPAIPLILIRPFLPESPAWQREEGGRHAEAPELRRAVPPAVPPDDDRDDDHDGVRVRARRSARSSRCRASCPACRRCAALPRPAQEQTVSARAVVPGIRRPGGPHRCSRSSPSASSSRRRLLHVFQIPGPDPAAARVPACRRRAASTLLQVGHLLSSGCATIAQFSFWGNYLPRVYPTYLRGTGESFAANVGGRMIGTCAALVTTQLVRVDARRHAVPIKLAYAAALVGTTAYVIGFIASFWLPEPKREELPE